MALLYYHNRQEVVTLVLLPGPLWPLCDDDKEPPEEIGATIPQSFISARTARFLQFDGEQQRWMLLTF
jgi:hypothetical protein